MYISWPKNKILKIFIWVCIIYSIINFVLAILWLGYAEGYKAGKKRAKQVAKKEFSQLIEKRFPTLFNNEFYSISGLIKEKGENFLIVEAVPPPKDIFDIPKKQDFKVFINKAEMLKRTLNPEAAPDQFPFKEEKIQLSDLEKGMKINIESKENIRGKNTFWASKVILEVF